MTNLLIATYQALVPTILLLESPGANARLAAYYQSLSPQTIKEHKFLPMELGQIPIEAEQVFDVAFGLAIPMHPARKFFQCVFTLPGEVPARRDYRELTIRSVAIRMEDDLEPCYKGDMVAYDEEFASLTLVPRTLLALNDVAKQIGGAHLYADPVPFDKTKAVYKKK